MWSIYDIHGPALLRIVFFEMSRGLERTQTLKGFVVSVISELACFVYTLGNYRSLAYQNIIATGYVYQNFMVQASSYVSPRL